LIGRKALVSEETMRKEKPSAMKLRKKKSRGGNLPRPWENIGEKRTKRP